MIAVDSPFFLSATYWPPHAAMYLWEPFDRDGLRRDWEAASHIGLANLALPLMWNDFQPDRHRVSVPAMRRLESALDLAADLYVRLTPILFPVQAAGINWLPDWVLTDGSGPAVISGHHRSNRAVRNLFSDVGTVEAEHLLVREIVHAFSGHPGLEGWVLGDGLTAASQPPSALAFADWSAGLADVAARAGANLPLWHGISARDLICSEEMEPAALTDAGLGTMVADDWRPGWGTNSGAWWPAFLAAYAARLTGSPAIVSGVGVCTAEPGAPSPPCLPAARAGVMVEEVLTRVHGAGGGGCRASSLFDFDWRLQSSKVLEGDPGAGTRGLLRAGGTPKETSYPWSSMAAGLPRVLPVPDVLAEVDREERAIDPEGTARQMYSLFTG